MRGLSHPQDPHGLVQASEWVVRKPSPGVRPALPFPHAGGLRTHALIEAIHAPDRGDMAVLFAAHDSTPIGWP